jgi:hypothetical protein
MSWHRSNETSKRVIAFQASGRYSIFIDNQEGLISASRLAMSTLSAVETRYLLVVRSLFVRSCGVRRALRVWATLTPPYPQNLLAARAPPRKFVLKIPESSYDVLA